MPRYDYKCRKCGLEFEVEHSVKEEPDVVCPNCGEEHGDVRRQISGTTAFVLKGKGWAKDGYR